MTGPLPTDRYDFPIFVAVRGNSSRNAIHLRHDCKQLQNAYKWNLKNMAMYPGETRFCLSCIDEVETPVGMRSPAYYRIMDTIAHAHE